MRREKDPTHLARESPLFGRKELREARWLIRRALLEDEVAGDRTSEALLETSSQSAGAQSAGARAARNGGLETRVAFVTRDAGVLCGLPVVHELFSGHASDVRITEARRDGDRVAAGTSFLEVVGPAASILRLERVALNFLCHLSGIATSTAEWVDSIAGTAAELFDTRKTTPAWRYLEKYAVRVGGARNHRMHLADALLVKDNHIAVLRAAGRWDLGERMRELREAVPGVFLQVEVDSREDFLQALDAPVDAILLDNFSLDDITWAVAERGRRGTEKVPLLEASGGIRLDTVRAVAETGVERISVGRLTHSTSDLDIGLDLLPEAKTKS